MSLWRRLVVLLRLVRPTGVADTSAEQQNLVLVVGLGNPGREYAGTRHNVGFEVIDRVGERLGADRFRSQFAGQAAVARLQDKRVLLLKPFTYMNESGRSVQQAAAFYGLDPSRLLVVCDDLNLPVGRIRARARGSDGGQKGLRSIARQLGTTEYPRLRIGIGSPEPDRDATDYVLGRFAKHERTLMEAALERAADAVVAWCESGIEHCMNRFN